MIVFADEQIDFSRDQLRVLGDGEPASVIRFSGRELTRDVLIKGQCEVLFIRSTTKVNHALLDATTVRFIATATTGTDHIDRDLLAQQSIAFFSAEGSNANAVAEYVIASLILLGNSPACWAEKTIGVIGYGRIGRLVAEYSRRLGMKVVVNDPPLFDSGFEFPKEVHHVSLAELAPSADIVTNHVPLNFTANHSTHHLLSRDFFEALRDSSTIVHSSRGGILDEDAVIEAMKFKQLRLAIDVWEGEPVLNHRLLGLTSIATPHIAGYTATAKRSGAEMVFDNYCNWAGIEVDQTHVPKTESSSEPRDFLESASGLPQSRSLVQTTNSMWSIPDQVTSVQTNHFDEIRKNYLLVEETLQSTMK